MSERGKVSDKSSRLQGTGLAVVSVHEAHSSVCTRGGWLGPRPPSLLPHPPLVGLARQRAALVAGVAARYAPTLTLPPSLLLRNTLHLLILLRPFLLRLLRLDRLCHLLQPFLRWVGKQGGVALRACDALPCAWRALSQREQQRKAQSTKVQQGSQAVPRHPTHVQGSSSSAQGT